VKTVTVYVSGRPSIQRIGCDFCVEIIMEVNLAPLKKIPISLQEIWVAKSSQSGKRGDEQHLFLWKILLQRQVQTATQYSIW